MGRYTELLEGLKLSRYYKLKENKEAKSDMRWYFRFGHYHFGYDEPDLENKKFIGYGKMVVDIDIYAATEEECAEKAYITLTNFGNFLLRHDTVSRD